MGGGDYHLGKKRASLHLSLFVVCLFLGVRDSRQNKKKENGARQKKNGGNECAGPPTDTQHLLFAVSSEILSAKIMVSVGRTVDVGAIRIDRKIRPLDYRRW